MRLTCQHADIFILNLQTTVALLQAQTDSVAWLPSLPSSPRCEKTPHRMPALKGIMYGHYKPLFNPPPRRRPSTLDKGTASSATPEAEKPPGETHRALTGPIPQHRDTRPQHSIPQNN